MPRLKVRNNDAVQFGAIIRRLRLERGWTIRKLAQRCGMNPIYLGVLEAGRNMPSLDTLLELADVFNVNAADMVREVEQPRREARLKRAAALLAPEPTEPAD